MSALTAADYSVATWCCHNLALELQRTLDLLGEDCPEDYHATLVHRMAEEKAREERFRQAYWEAEKQEERASARNG